MIMRILAGSIIALGLGLMTEGARAEQMFICSDGTLRQVAHQDLERLKRQDACIARHFGIEIAKVPLPVKRPKHLLPTKPRTTQHLQLKRSANPERQHSANRSVASIWTDYRKVRIINALPGSRPWYRHTR